MRVSPIQLVLFFALFVLSSCEFHCSIGSESTNKERTHNEPIRKNGTTLLNGIELTANKMKVSKAYLVLANGERVPDDNVVDFNSPVKMLLLIDSGWTTINKRVWIGASEKVVAPNGEILLNEKDLFTDDDKGADATDAKIIGLTVTLKFPGSNLPDHLVIPFKVWDKKGEGYIEGSYTLYSK